MAEGESLKSRRKDLDIVRALCALWVVGYWHLVCYLPEGQSFYTPLGQCVTEIFMACFFFISGFLHNRYRFGTKEDVRRFYFRKFQRFYVLFLLSAVTLYIANLYIGQAMFTGPLQLLLTLTGLTTFFPPHAGMLWFMSMLMLFYLLTPFIMVKDASKRYLRLALAMTSFLAWLVIFGKLDIMVFVYFTVYAAGLVCSPAMLERLRNSPYGIAIAAIIVSTGVSVCISDASIKGGIRLFITTADCLAGTLLLLALSGHMAKSGIIAWVGGYIAYSSMCAYLFHRHFYSVIGTVLEHLHISVTAPVLMCVYLPVCITASFVIQKIYDRVMGLLKTKRPIRIIA